MIEQAMFFLGGVLTTCLITIFVANAVWRRAVRLTAKRVQAALPVSLAEIKADRDQLRAEFAMSARKLELAVEDLKRRSQTQLIDLAKKNDQLRLLLAEVKERTDTIRAMEENEQNHRAEFLKTEAQLGETVRALKEAEAKLADAHTTLVERDNTIGEARGVADSRRIEIAALQTNVARFEDQVADLKRTLDNAETDRALKQVALAKAEVQLAEARSNIGSLEAKLAAADAAIKSQGEELGRLQSRLIEQSAQLTGHLSEADKMAARIQTLLKEREALDTELTRRTAEAEVRAKSLLDELQNFRADKAALEGRLAAETTERERVTAELKRLESAATENWERERVENALLRERMNDLAAEVTAMTMTLEGENSPIRKVVAAAEAGLRDAATVVATSAPSPAKADDPRRLSLAERVRALQARATMPR